MSSGEVLCEVFASSRRAGSYLFVRREDGLDPVPEALLASFGTPRSVMTLKLHPGRRLAQASAERVLEEIARNGFYLQLPPADPRPAIRGDGTGSGASEPGQGSDPSGGGDAC